MDLKAGELLRCSLVSERDETGGGSGPVVALDRSGSKREVALDRRRFKRVARWSLGDRPGSAD